MRQLQQGMMVAGKYVGVDRAIHWDGKTKSGESVASSSTSTRLMQEVTEQHGRW